MQKIEFRKTFEMVDKSEKQSESPANKMLDHTIGKKFETAPLTWATVRSTNPVTVLPGAGWRARTQSCSPTNTVTTTSGRCLSISSTAVPSARADSVNVYVTTAIMNITDENDLILWYIYLCLILFFWERRVTQKCRNSLYCWHYICLC